MLYVCMMLFISPAVFSAPLYMRDISNVAGCSEQGDCIAVSTDCNQICGCDNLHYFDESRNECVLNLAYLRKLIGESNNAEVGKLRSEAERVFNGLIISALLFITCASTCVLTACIYCCHISYSDQKLRSDVKALAEKLNRDGKLTKPKKIKTRAEAESCNVICEDAGVFVC